MLVNIKNTSLTGIKLSSKRIRDSSKNQRTKNLGGLAVSSTQTLEVTSG
jgi:hypothetical protein